MSFWQHLPQRIHPVLISLGPMQIRWYGLMYLAAFFVVYLLVLRRLRSEKWEYSRETISDFFTWAIFGLIAGGRLGYVLLYDPNYYLAHPLEIILPLSFQRGFHYTGLYGMSYHGGLLGVILAAIVFCRRRGVRPLRFADLIAPAVPLGYFFGRIGNFINGELYGRVTARPWGMYFPLDPYHQLRHPSQLYEAAGEGLILFVILWGLRRLKWFDGFLLAMYLAGYGLIRFVLEFFREPDPQVGFVLWNLTLGQLLCLVMIAAGGAIFILKKKS